MNRKGLEIIGGVIGLNFFIHVVSDLSWMQHSLALLLLVVGIGLLIEGGLGG